MTIAQLWNNADTYFKRLYIMRLAGYSRYHIEHRCHSFFLSWEKVNPITQRMLERAWDAGKYQSFGKVVIT